MGKKEYYVYEWIRLDTNEPFYVGKGKNKRWCVLQRNNRHFNNIVNSIPTVVSILKDNLDENDAYKYECWYIHIYKYVYAYDLVNILDGGEVIPVLKGKDNPMWGRPWWNDDTPQYKIDSWRNKLDKNRIGMLGKKHNLKTRLLFSKQRRGRKLTEEWKKNISENASKWNLGKITPLDVRLKISQNHADVSGKNNPRATKVYIYNSDFNLLFVSDTIIEGAEWLKNNGYIRSINNGRSIINRHNNGKIYKGLYFKKELVS